ncbi:MAG: TIGR00341 family protein [Sphingomonadaceae bacterium]
MTEPVQPSQGPSSGSSPEPKSSNKASSESVAEEYLSSAARNLRDWWHTSVINTVDQADVIARRRDDAQMSARYIFMLMMSAAIAVLGLLQNSPAVIIGAMLLSPLMGPIMGGGFSLAIGDFHWLRDSTKTLLIGTIMSILFCTLIVLMSPIQTVTTEIAARTRPNLFDLLIALFSALAGAYAMIRGREGTVVGVAIATALMPPLAVVGFGLATWNGTVFWGALMLFFTNLMTIALTAAVMARVYGFRTMLSEKQTRMQTIAIIVIFVALAIPLAVSLRQIAWESQASSTIDSELRDAFGSGSRVADINIDWNSEPVGITATVLTPQIQQQAEKDAKEAIEKRLKVPVALSLTQYQVGTSASAAEAAELSSNRAKEDARQKMIIQEMTDGLALIAGVPPEQVVIDAERKVALVKANILKGAGMASYRELEQRVTVAAPLWTVLLRPPAVDLPSVAFSGQEPSAEGSDAIDTIAWASKRLDTPVILSGPVAQVENVRGKLSELGIAVSVSGNGRDEDVVIARWAPPNAQQEAEARARAQASEEAKAE